MYNFDTVIDRSGTGACKWERRNAYEVAHGILPMSVADMEFQSPPCVRAAVLRAAEHGVYGYTDPTPAFHAALSEWMLRRHNLDVQAKHIVTINGVVPALGVAVRALTRTGDGVIYQPPVYHPFRMTIERNGRRLEPCALKIEDGRYVMDFDALERAARKPDVRLMILCSPHNPVGRVWTREELSHIDAICRANGVVVLSDEIHADLVLTGTHIPFSALSPEARDNCLVCTAPSKTFNMPGLQTSNILIASDALRAKFQAQAQCDGFENLSYFGHAAAIAAYREGGAWLDAVLSYIANNYTVLERFLCENMPEVELYPMEGTYLAWADFRELGLDAEALEHFTREEAHLILDEGYIFGDEGAGFERFNLALPRAELERALDRLQHAYSARFQS